MWEWKCKIRCENNSTILYSMFIFKLLRDCLVERFQWIDNKIKYLIPLFIVWFTCDGIGFSYLTLSNSAHLISLSLLRFWKPLLRGIEISPLLTNMTFVACDFTWITLFFNHDFFQISPSLSHKRFTSFVHPINPFSVVATAFVINFKPELIKSYIATPQSNHGLNTSTQNVLYWWFPTNRISTLPSKSSTI